MDYSDCDFMGYVTRNDVQCSDGRTIRRNAFKAQDGEKVPLVWNHDHDDIHQYLGHTYLENRKDGVYGYSYFNDTETGQYARELVEHGDIVAMSIYANKLKQTPKMDVLHGEIKEVSLVMAGANPGAFIEDVMAHGEVVENAAIIFSGENLTLCHHDRQEGSMARSKKRYERDEELLHEEEYDEDDEYEDDEDEEYDDEESIADVLSELDDRHLEAVYAAIGIAASSAQDDGYDEDEEYDDDDEEYDEDYDEDMAMSDYDEEEFALKHNAFDDGSYYASEGGTALSHEEVAEIFEDAKRGGSLKEAVLAHASDPTGPGISYGITDIDYLFPDAKNLNVPPAFIQRDMGWVQKVMRGVRHTPFSRIKSMFADITEDEARARGYIKGNLKKEEVFSLLKRSTTPTTIYKKQKLDRDDVVDITDFDVVAWLKAEMRMMLDEEIARAVLIGDGRLASSDDKINETNIRPICSDAELYTIQVAVSYASDATDDDKAKAMIRAAIKARKDYKGTGSPTLFTTEDVLTDCLLLEDKVGRVIYDSVEKLKTTLRVSDIVTVPVMEGAKIKVGSTNPVDKNMLGIIVNLTDYTVGADKGGAINMFDDFDIDYNAQKYLIETRCSGALTKPKSAMVLYADPKTASTGGGT